MDGGLVVLIIVVVVVLFMLTAVGGSSSQGLSSGSKKGKFGVVGLVVALFAILGLSNYLQPIM